MDFELENLEMIETPAHYPSTPRSLDPVRQEALKSQSLILTELQKENEDLQNKVKLTYRRLLLFEAENNKLIEEKNKYFFEAQNHIEKSKILEEKNAELENENGQFDQRLQILNEKVYTFEKINRTQLGEIKRFSKFHLKIQNVVKPYILKLKRQLASTQEEFRSSQFELKSLKTQNEDLSQKLHSLREQKETQEQISRIDKTSLIGSYEEQIHTFSKEILNQQNQNESLIKEISRLKKAVEFKNYYENEVIKFKRIHEEDQQSYQALLDQKNAFETQLAEKSSELGVLKIDLNQTKSRLDDKENVLEVTRTQLAKQIDEAVVINERLNRLEKLNNQLSREI